MQTKMPFYETFLGNGVRDIEDDRIVRVLSQVTTNIYKLIMLKYIIIVTRTNFRFLT